jgi:hypothetical protein
MEQVVHLALVQPLRSTTDLHSRALSSRLSLVVESIYHANFARILSN